MTNLAPTSGRNRRVLLAEDDPSTNTLLTGVLVKWGFEVVSVTTGSDALAELSKPGAPQMAVLDWMMPNMTGYEVSLKLAENVRRPVYVILLTAKSESSDVVKAMQAGVNDFINKPVNFQDLRTRLEAGFRMLDLRLAFERERFENLQRSHLASLGVMASGAAHEIKNPLTILIGSVRKIKSELAKPQPDLGSLVERSERIEHEARKIGAIVDGLNDLATEGGAEEFISATAADLEKSFALICRSRFVASGIEFSSIGFSERVRFDYQPQALGRAVLHLLNNSYDAVLALETRWVRIVFEAEANCVRIRVTDSGSGIAEDVRARLKEPFFTTKEVGNGVGLGLAVANSVIENHHGTLVYNPAVKNTEFVITLLVKPMISAESTAA